MITDWTDTGGIISEPFRSPHLGAVTHAVLGFLVNVGPSLPFIILMVLLAPVSGAIVGSSIGSAAAAVPLTVAAIPFFARFVEIALRDVDEGLVDAAKSLGARRGTIIILIVIVIVQVVQLIASGVVRRLNHR